MTPSIRPLYAIPNELAELIAATDGQREAEWQGRRVLLVHEPWGALAVSLHGGQVLHYAPRGQAPWLWLSPTPREVPGAIRGGIPLCWPWFGDREDGQGPAHGVARTAQWQLDSCDEHHDGIEVQLSPQEALDEQLAPRVIIQANHQRLRVELLTEHVGETPVRFTQALHSYLAVGSTHSCRVEGLAGATYIDKLRGFHEYDQQGELAIRGALDRIYHSSRPLTLVDSRSEGEHRLLIRKEGSDSSVVWHPGAEAPSDIPQNSLYGFLCVEAACTQLDPIWLAPGGQHLLAQEFSLATSE